MTVEVVKSGVDGTSSAAAAIFQNGSVANGDLKGNPNNTKKPKENRRRRRKQKKKKSSSSQAKDDGNDSDADADAAPLQVSLCSLFFFLWSHEFDLFLFSSF